LLLPSKRSLKTSSKMPSPSRLTVSGLLTEVLMTSKAAL
jgi:hypothetical protein